MITTLQLMDILGSHHPDTEVRVGDVVEGSNFHCTVGDVVLRNGVIVITPGDDLVWRDETVASENAMRQLWPTPEDEP